MWGVGGGSRPQEAGQLWDAEQGRAAATETCCPAGADPGERGRGAEGWGGEMIPTGMGQTGWRQVGVPWSQVSQLSRGVKQPWRCEAPPPSGGGQRDPGPRARDPGADLSPSAAAGRSNSRSQSLRSTDARRREELGDELQQFGFPSPQTGELHGWMG